jgi:hypothetical protein
VEGNMEGCVGRRVAKLEVEVVHRRVGVSDVYVGYD